MPAIIISSGLQSGGGSAANLGPPGRGNRVEAGRTEWPAAGKAPHSQPQAASAPVRLDRLARVLRAGGEESARRRPALEGPLVEGDRAQHQTGEPASAGIVANALDSSCSSCR